MDPLDAIKRAQATRLVRKDGKEVELEVGHALEPAEIERVAVEAGAPLSRELRALLEQTAGVDGGPLQTIDFTGRSFSFGAPETLPWALPIAADGEPLCSFAAELDERFTFVDLRSCPVGMGFLLGPPSAFLPGGHVAVEMSKSPGSTPLTVP